MCVYYFAWDMHPRYNLVVAGNRDEFYSRPSEPAHYWEDPPAMLAGRDVAQGGAWFAVNRSGKFAFITNFRDLSQSKPDAVSRGILVRDYFSKSILSEEYLAAVASGEETFLDFNLIAGDPSSVNYHASRTGKSRTLKPGVYGISNHLLDTPWPKVSSGKKRFRELIDNDQILDPEEFLPLLSDRSEAADELLPDTGVGLDWERKLSPIFIETETYGTQMSTVLLVARNGETVFLERTFDPTAGLFSMVRHTFKLKR